MPELVSVTSLSSNQAEEVVAVFCDAFHDYPVMRFVLGEAPSYDDRLRTLIGLFVAARAFRNEPLLGVRDDDGTLLAAATVTLPEAREPSLEFAARREAAWEQLGADARVRYEAFGAATEKFAVATPHHHLNMIGVRRARQGRGLARALLGAVHEMARSPGASAGVSLTTENAANLALYEHFGYRVLGSASVAGVFETWTLFRPNGAPAGVSP